MPERAAGIGAEVKKRESIPLSRLDAVLGRS
jgi:hypothetical protein